MLFALLKGRGGKKIFILSLKQVHKNRDSKYNTILYHSVIVFKLWLPLCFSGFPNVKLCTLEIQYYCDLKKDMFHLTDKSLKMPVLLFI